MILDNAVQTKPVHEKIFNSLDNLESTVGGGTPTRVGSLLYWELQLNKKFTFQAALQEFAATPLAVLLEPVSNGTALKRFADAITRQQTIPDVKFLIDRDSNAKCWFISWYTGSAGEYKTDFLEWGKVLVTDEFSVGLVATKSEFIIKDKTECEQLLIDSFLITDREFQIAMALYANSKGWRLSQSGGYYFMPLPETSDLYNLKAIFQKHDGRIRITPLIFCNDQDAEEISECIGNHYAEMIQKAEQTVFETNMAIYKFTKYWADFKTACISYSTADMTINKISHTQYGKQLVSYLKNLYCNASVEEYRHLAKKRLDEIKPKERITPSAIKNIIVELKEAEEKLQSISNIPLLEKCEKRVQSNLLSLKVLVRKAASMMSEDLLELL